jgi:hypothetical protein
MPKYWRGRALRDTNVMGMEPYLKLIMIMAFGIRMNIHSPRMRKWAVSLGGKNERGRIIEKKCRIYSSNKINGPD